MQSFRTFIQEDVEPQEFPRFFQSFIVHLTETEEYYESLIQREARELAETVQLPEGIEKLSVTTSGDLSQIRLGLDITKPEFADENKLLPTWQLFREAFSKFSIMQKGQHATFAQNRVCVVNKTLPPFLTSCGYVKIGTSLIKKQTPKSLHNIHKLLDCHKLDLFNGDQVEECVLGLLMMKRLNDFSVPGQSRPEWLVILESYLREKDLIECKEEMIEKGMKQYARL